MPADLAQLAMRVLVLTARAERRAQRPAHRALVARLASAFAALDAKLVATIARTANSERAETLIALRTTLGTLHHRRAKAAAHAILLRTRAPAVANDTAELLGLWCVGLESLHGDVSIGRLRTFFCSVLNAFQHYAKHQWLPFVAAHPPGAIDRAGYSAFFMFYDTMVRDLAHAAGKPRKVVGADLRRAIFFSSVPPK